MLELKQPKRPNARPSRIAFGSCNEQARENKMWPIIESRKATAFVWGGDSIYADIEKPANLATWPPKPSQKVCATPDRVRRLYEQQLAVPGYNRLVKSNITIFGTIDDHDYGCDNADKYFPYKYETTNAFIDFIGEPEESPMAQRSSNGRGVYGVKLFDFDRAEGQELVPEAEACVDPEVSCIHQSPHAMYSNKTVAVFVLDVRTNKDPWVQGAQAYYGRDTGDFLGQDQWEWFEKAISSSRAAVNVVVNGLQVSANLFPNPNIAESWAGFPRSQQRLFDAILGDSVASPILISGDVHMTQMMRKDCRKRDDPHQRRPVMEMTTSGMTHSWGRLHAPPLDNLEYQHPMHERIETFVGALAMHIMHYLRPWTQILVSSSDPSVTHDGGIDGAKEGLQYSLERNFGELEFDWDQRTVTLRSIGEDAGPLLATKVLMEQLSGRTAFSTLHLSEDEFRAEMAEQHPLIAGEWICISHRGRIDMATEMVGQVRTILGIGACFALPILVPAFSLGLLWNKQRSKRRLQKKAEQNSLPS